MYRFFPYYYEEALQKFVPVKLRYTRTYVNIHEELSKGMRTQVEYENAFNLYGQCQIEVPYKGICGIFVDEVLSPFYLFQVILCG